MPNAGTTYVEVVPKLDNFGRDLSSGMRPAVEQAGRGITKQTTGITSRLSGVARSFTKVALPIAAAGTAAAVAYGKASIEAYTESAKVGAQTAAVIKSQGGAAGVTAGHVQKLAGSIRDYSGIEDEAIQGGANMLLTFRNIQNQTGKGNDIFDRATKTLADMSVALGKDPSTAAVQLGKALNDPVKGITALSRVGVQFTDGQKKQIAAMVKAGHTADAQKMILGELTKEFGGSAKAMGKANPAAILKSQMGDVQETVGKNLMPIMLEFSRVLADAMKELAPAATDLLKSMAPLFLMLAKLAVPVLNALVVVITKLMPILPALAGAIGTLLIIGKVTKMFQAFAAFAPIMGQAATVMMGPWGLVIAALVAGAILIYTHWDTIKKFLLRAWATIKKAAVAVWSWVVGFFRKVGPWLLAALFGPIGLLVKFIIGHWDAIKRGTQRVWNNVVDFVKGIPGKIKAAFVGAARWLYDIGQAIITGLWDGMKHQWENVTHFVGGIGSWIKDHKGPIERDRRLLQPEGGAIMDGLATGLKRRLPGVTDVIGAAKRAIESPIGAPGVAGRAGFGGGVGATAALLGGARGRGLAIAGDLEIVNWDSGRARIRGDIVAAMASDNRFRQRRSRVG
jgi:hypothetical protein